MSHYTHRYTNRSCTELKWHLPFELSTRLLKKFTLVQHFVDCDRLVFQTGADLLLKVHFLLCVRAY